MLLSEFRSKTKSLPDLLPWGALVDNGIVLNKSGALMAGFHFRGPDLDSSTRGELTSIAGRINAALQLPDGWSLHVDALRQPSFIESGEVDYPNRTTRLLGEARDLARSGDSSGYDSRFAMVLCWHPDADAAGKAEAVFVSGGDNGCAASRSLKRFKSTLRDIRDRLSGVLQIERMIDEELPDGSLSSPLLAHLQECVSFEKRPRFVVPETPMYLDAVLGRRQVVVGFEPVVGKKTVIAIALTGMPASSHPGILDFLGRLPVEYRWSNRFIFLGPREADKEIQKYRSKWAQRRLSLLNLLRSSQGGQVSHINLDADAMTNDAIEAEGVASSGLVRFGYWTSVLLLADENAKLVRETARSVIKEIVNRGFDAAIEDVNAMECYIGSMPGNTYANVRRPLIHTLNLSHFLPFTAVWSGPEKHPCPFYPPGSGPLMVAKTDGSTPYRLCLHAGDVGHTAIVGPTGSGKSTLLASLAAAHFRYPNAQVFAFDKGYSMKPLVLAAGGTHYDIAGEDSTLAFCPLARIDTDSDRSWAAEWIESLCEMQGMAITPDVRRSIYDAVVQLAEQTTERSQRTMSDYVTTAQHEGVRAALQYYTLHGPAGSLLDAQTDALEDDIFQVFEVEHLMARGEKIVVPVLTYLFHRLEQRFTGRPTLLILDEAWLMLGHPVFRAKLREWLKVLRKANVAVVFATQSLTDLTKSGIADVLFESCPSKILLANAEAQTEIVRPLYEQMGLNERQIQLIAQATPKAHYYHIHPMWRRLFSLGLSAEELAFVGKSDKPSLKRIDALRAADPVSWPAAWLRECKLNEAADAWLGY